jgi:hypothetical protein
MVPPAIGSCLFHLYISMRRLSVCFFRRCQFTIAWFPIFISCPLLLHGVDLFLRSFCAIHRVDICLARMCETLCERYYLVCNFGKHSLVHRIFFFSVHERLELTLIVPLQWMYYLTVGHLSGVTPKTYYVFSQLRSRRRQFGKRLVFTEGFVKVTLDLVMCDYIMMRV